jgi:hypothetical protein
MMGKENLQLGDEFDLEINRCEFSSLSPALITFANRAACFFHWCEMHIAVPSLRDIFAVSSRALTMISAHCKCAMQADRISGLQAFFRASSQSILDRLPESPLP